MEPFIQANWNLLLKKKKKNLVQASHFTTWETENNLFTDPQDHGITQDYMIFLPISESCWEKHNDGMSRDPFVDSGYF